MKSLCESHIRHLHQLLRQRYKKRRVDRGKHAPAIIPFQFREGCGKSKWKFKMAFAIRRPTPPPPLNGTNFQTFFYPTFFLLQLNPTDMKRILHFKNITFKSSYNWFKIDIHQQVRPLTANYLAMFKVISTTIYT